MTTVQTPTDNHRPSATGPGSSDRRRARRLVAAGALAGPVLAVAFAGQAITRDGYDVTRHPMSLLALGPGGGVQVAAFVVAGLLLLALARGLTLVRTPGTGGRWEPRLVTVAGLGLVAAGVFTTDPGAGFPAGAPAGRPDLSWHGVLHEVAFVVVMLSWTATVLVVLRHARRAGDTGLATAAAVVLATVVVLSALPHADSFPVRTLAATVVQLGFLAAVAAVRLRRCRVPG